MKRIVLFFLFMLIITACEKDKSFDLERTDNTYIIDLRSGKEEIIATVHGGRLGEGVIDHPYIAGVLVAGDHSISSYLVGFETIAYWEQNKLMKDSKYGEVIAIIDHSKIIQGDSEDGLVIGRIEGRDPHAGFLGAAYMLIAKNKYPEQYSPNKIFRGDSKTGEVIALADNGILISSNSTDDKIILKSSFERIVRPKGSFSDTMANIHNNKIIKGSSQNGEVIALIDGNKVIKGENPDGEVIAYVERQEARAAAMAAVYLLLIPEDER